MFTPSMQYTMNFYSEKSIPYSELADELHIDTIDVLNMDDKRLKDVEEPLKSEMIPILRGGYMDRLPD